MYRHNNKIIESELVLSTKDGVKQKDRVQTKMNYTEGGEKNITPKSFMSNKLQQIGYC